MCRYLCAFLTSVLLSLPLTHQAQAQATAPAVTPNGAPAEPSLQELAQRMERAHAGVSDVTGVSAPPKIQLDLPQLDARPGRANGVQIFARQLLPGLAMATGLTFLSWAVPPLIFSVPFATAGIVYALGDFSKAEGGYGGTLLGGLAGFGVGLMAGALIARGVRGGHDAEADEDEGWSNFYDSLVGISIGAVIGTTLGSIAGYHISDREVRKERSKRRVALRGGAAPSTNGVSVCLAGSF